MALSWSFVDHPTYITVNRTIDGTVDSYDCNKQLIHLRFTEPELFFLYSRPDDLRYHEFLINFNDVTSPVVTSASDLNTQLQAMIDSMGGGVTAWEVISTDTHQLENNKGYIIDNVNLCTLTLPVASVQGDLILIVGKSANGWKVEQNASQQIFLGSVSTVVGAGSGIESANANDCAELVCITDDLEYDVRNTSPNTTLTLFAPFVPTDVAGCILWADADSESAGALATWTDLSGNANDLTQATATNQPTVVASVIDGHNVVRFDGVDNYLQSPSVSLSVRTEFFVIKKNGAFTGSYHAIISQSSGDFYQLYVHVGNTFTSYVGVNRDHLVAFDSTFTLIRRVVSATSVNVWKNGVAGTSGAHAGGVLNSAFLVGGIAGNFLNGDIAEIIVYNSDLSAPDIALVEAYLNDKYPSL